ncbi:MAG: di-heme oxidoredictase family protein [Acidimicrobiia bacterium]
MRKSKIFVFATFIISCFALILLTETIKTTYDPSVVTSNDQAFSRPLKSLNKNQKSNFIKGKLLFHGIKNDTRSLESKGIGPFYNALSCGDCHQNDGTADPDSSPSLVIKFQNNNHGDSTYGYQLQTKSLNGFTSEGSNLNSLNYGAIDKTTKTYTRIAPRLIGMGLIEAIPDSFFYRYEDTNDANKDGISGRIAYIKNKNTNKKEIARFGWKATQIDVKEQTMLASSEDLGLISSKYKFAICPKKVSCISKPEISDDQINQIVTYTRSLAPPRKSKSESQGKAIFNNLGCSSCHIETIKLEKSDIVIKDDTEIHPYSDFLLHNMGAQLADSTSIQDRNADEFRTAPLWGLGKIEKVNKSLNLLHDGRAKTIDEAIKFHGGEASKTKDAYIKLSSREKALILKYLNSL